MASGDYVKVVLFTDFDLSKRDLLKRQREADEETHDGLAARRRKEQARPIAQHVAEYVDDLRRTVKSSDHVDITKGMLGRLVALAGWNRLIDISKASMEAALKKLDEDGKSANYRNDYIKKAKAFVSWCIPDRIKDHPLAKLKRGNTTRAKKPRARRAAMLTEMRSLFAVLPERMQLSVAFMLLTGFRRSEAASLCWDDLRLNAPIPFIQLRPSWTKNEKVDSLPLHRVLVSRFRALTPGMPTTHVFRSILECETFEKYLELAEVSFVNARGLRLDVHALRHTFSTWLDETGCPWTTKKALTRHAQSEVADGYSHARLAILSEFVQRLPSPWSDEAAQGVLRTGTDPSGSGGASASVLPGNTTAGFPGNFSESDYTTWVLGRNADEGKILAGHGAEASRQNEKARRSR